MSQILDALQGIDDVVFGLIPSDPDPTDPFQRQLIDLHTRFRDQIALLALQEVQLSTDGLAAQATQLGAINTQIQAVAGDISTAKEVIKYASQALSVAVQVAAAVVA